jgi:hypothetical protein
MKKKNLLMTAVAIFGLATITNAQVPSYVPTNGLVGYWPFNGNANDASTNNLGGNVLGGPTLTTDRNGNSNASYDFDYSTVSFGGQTDEVYIPFNSILNSTNISVSVWVYPRSYYWSGNPGPSAIIRRFEYGYSNPNGQTWGIDFNQSTLYAFILEGASNNSQNNATVTHNTPLSLNTWHHIVFTYNGASLNLYLDGALVNSVNATLPLNTAGNSGISIGESNQTNGYWHPTDGKIDDIGIWNRALTQQEITDLFNTVICANNTAITPQTNSLATGNTATFTASTTDPNPSYVWQSDFGQGFQTLNNIGNYSGTNTSTLSIANVQLPNHTQPIRVITTSGNCIDTSNVAVINILDTCITNVTVYDTLLTTVTDTLVINATITGINPPNNLNTLKVFPNPASTHITIDYGNFNAMSGYTLKIINSVGQTVFSTPINQQTSYIDLSTWTGNGIYFVQLIDTQNNTIENRKIVIQ